MPEYRVRVTVLQTVTADDPELAIQRVTDPLKRILGKDMEVHEVSAIEVSNAVPLPLALAYWHFLQEGFPRT